MDKDRDVPVNYDATQGQTTGGSWPLQSRYSISELEELKNYHFKKMIQIQEAIEALQKVRM